MKNGDISYFYRFEYENYGVYTSHLCADLNIKHCDNEHPSPRSQEGIKRYVEDDERNGFVNLDQILAIK